ncbi:MAG: translation initiation factor IF-2 [Tissierellia bacterium]|nr:translation initiation factor IF-2 [Tissierellia bacterium]
MRKIRVYELAKEYKMTSKNLITKLESIGIEVANHMSTLDEEEHKKFIDFVKGELASDKPEPKKAESPEPKRAKAPEKKKDKPKKLKKAIPVAEEPDKDAPKRNWQKRKRGTKADYRRDKEEKIIDLAGSEVEIDEVVTLGELAEKLQKPATEIIMKFMSLGEMYNINSNISFEEAEILAMEYEVKLVRAQSLSEIEEEMFDFEDAEEDLIERAPVVTVMGHVDHGKTSLLDSIRNTRVTKKEAGGITQHIGASEIKIDGKKIVFLDTPGHEAFTTLRARGAQITDISILVVAADDGVKPQTVEAIHHAKAAGVPIIVAINKMDKPTANPDRVKQELTEHGLVVEDWGGDIIAVEVSAKTGEGVENLLEMVLLVAEMLELKANPDRPGVGTIIEANVDRRMGTTATVLLEKGRMKIGDNIFAGASFGRIRTMINDAGKRLKTAGPSSAFEITGLNDVPMAGEKIYVTVDDQTARLYAERNAEKERSERIAQPKLVASLDSISEDEGQAKVLNVILRADVHGSVEAIKNSLDKINTDEVMVNIIKSQVGAITEADILLATASEAVILGFNVRPDNNIQNVAERENVEIRTYRVIYDIVNDVKDALSGMLDPDQKEVVEGNIEVRDTFKVPGVGTIAGGYVMRGQISRTSMVRLIRDGIVIHEGEVSSLRRFKDDVRQVQTGYECGIGIKNYNDIKEGDIIETFIIKEIQRSLD